ncbi:hypothetical protein METBIDRAFT_117841 [Metschnikowia bicuspidata var. bicuspidata NRRL YB-4993]|uniref:Uncharacterized protein n=1 Tax=Metschnikowia bicuspidata var. bicuspidata NRRL YB-4993 TaxID=869754 RepID=A0A1A0HJN4_9ASCO|nr:hypothetical protein METBIDRAFT_117841 [Metschnikowia bicuspidata var. bicuspidata NRRL YB-4993]OBA24102.1 hypothetical protein METBIDRAFT_117841 [Metschnikowia bicuspidata var. bicuspidata NRRL YB-4993]
MVLNKSKWDHKAKIQYLRKHNLTRPKPTANVNRPKWSAKKSQGSQGTAWLDEEDDSDWDLEDEAFLNHFYPQISEDHLSVENKQKLKRQIIKIVKARENGEPEVQEHASDEEDGIYLGARPVLHEAESFPEDEEDAESGEEYLLEIADLETKLSEFVVSDMGKLGNRKMLKNKILDNLLDEYGLDSYASTVKTTDYNNSAKLQFRNVDRLTAADLHGFRIGGPKNEPKQPSVQALDATELEAHRARAEKLRHVKFHDQIKKKFGDEPAKKTRVLEINNFNANDEMQMAALNSRLTLDNGALHRATSMDEDLDVLLGLESGGQTQQPPLESLDFLQDTLPWAGSLKREPARKETKKKESHTDSFLDDLLGI